MSRHHHPLVTAAEIAAVEEVRFVHQFNERAIRNTKSLGDLVGLTEIGVHLVRVEPGDETTQYHNHDNTDEFIYILSGRGLAVIDDEEFEVGPGDFMGFVKGGAYHGMRNTGDEDLVYLVGGNRKPIDVVNYPHINRRMYRIHGRREFVDLDDVEEV